MRSQTNNPGTGERSIETDGGAKGRSTVGDAGVAALATSSLDVDTLDYVSFIALLNETNRPPGGKATVRFWIQNAHLSPASDVLEIGSNTGFTSLELARSCGCRVTGIDISPAAVEVARGELAADVPAVRERVRFEVADALEIPAEGDAFDAVVCGGALSFVRDRERALVEIGRVLRPWGFVCVSPLAYHSQPPEALLDDLEGVLGFRVPVFTSADWLELFRGAGFEVYVARQLPLASRPDSAVEAYVDYLVAGRLPEVPDESVPALRRRALRTFRVFNENHRYLEALQSVLRLRPLPEQWELFAVDQLRQ
ncbi:MAG: class I SAM-dependent methyltransferase [Actinomycetota bacterium]|nr:class I SAM-dependent methyltransferase [Actinomycetota bacterium]